MRATRLALGRVNCGRACRGSESGFWLELTRVSDAAADIRHFNNRCQPSNRRTARENFEDS